MTLEAIMMESMKNSLFSPLRIAINAQLVPDIGTGGIQSVLIGLITALGRLQDGPEEYIVIANPKHRSWLNSFLGPNERVVSPPAPVRSRKLEFGKYVLGPLRPAVRKIWRAAISHTADGWPQVPISDGFFESLNCDVIHFPYQDFVLCAMPSIYNPHDLQHLHYPRFFTAKEIAWRETIYPAGCRFSRYVVAGSQWIKRDVVCHYGLDSSKVQVIPWAPPTEALPNPSPATVQATLQKYRLKQPYGLYPAMTWEHKNHLRLLQSMALLQHDGRPHATIVCCGAKNHFWPVIENQLIALGLEKEVKFLGLIPKEELRALYSAAQFFVIPTLFEAASGPLLEAWLEGVPVACSNVTSLPQQAAGAAQLFDPLSVQSIAEAIERMSTDSDLREQLRRRGSRRLRDFSWERTAKAYRALYRKAAGRDLTEEERCLLDWDWMREPELCKEATDLG